MDTVKKKEIGQSAAKIPIRNKVHRLSLLGVHLIIPTFVGIPFGNGRNFLYLCIN
nr:MAG TPA: hypothetical protein [Bacteriophage sp.]DAI57951.1 MAG TPA: hypothetical protein [Caudoviricetes sp.]